MKKIIVVGLSAASISFITKLRSFDKESELICFSAESDMPYNRCLLADFLTGEISASEIFLKSADFFEKNNIQFFLNCPVTLIDAEKKYVVAQEQLYFYDTLFLGIGTRSIVPRWVNQKVDGIFQFHTLADMKAIQSYLYQYKPVRAVIVGAGLNGLEAASSLIQRGVSVTIVEAQANILPGQVEPALASWIERIMCEQGVNVVTNVRVESIIESDGSISSSNDVPKLKSLQLVLNDTTRLQADMVIVTIGSRLNSELLEQMGLNLSDGSVVVDQHMKTSIPDVLAAGDICAVADINSGKSVRSCTWSDAMLQGLCAATSLGVTPRLYQGYIGLRDSYFFGLDFYACGQTLEHDDTVVAYRTGTDASVRMVYLRDGMVVGFVLLGDISSLVELKRCYLTRTLVDPNNFS